MEHRLIALDRKVFLQPGARGQGLQDFFLAIRSATRSGRVLATVILLEAPSQFYQVVFFSSRKPFSERLLGYLDNALEARGHSPRTAFDGQCFVLGVVDSKYQGLLKSKLRFSIGAEKAEGVAQRIQYVVSSNAVRIPFSGAGGSIAFEVKDLQNLTPESMQKHFVEWGYELQASGDTQ